MSMALIFFCLIVSFAKPSAVLLSCVVVIVDVVRVVAVVGNAFAAVAFSFDRVVVG